MNWANKGKIAALILLAVFGLVWFEISASTPPWFDEFRHLSAAKSMIAWGKPIVVDTSSDVKRVIRYARGKVITYPVMFLYKHGLTQLAWMRLIPLVFVLLTLLFWVAYLSYRHRWNEEGTVLLLLFFLGQPMVLEQSTYLRMYAPLGLVFSIVSVCLWELKEAWKTKQFNLLCLLLTVLFLGMWVPKLDSWHNQQVPQLLLALFMLNQYGWKASVFWVRKPLYSLLFFMVLLWLAPMVVDVLNQWVPRMSMEWGIWMGYAFETYWDNVGGLIRFMLAVNFMLIGLRWIFTRPGPYDIFRWLYLSGLFSGIGLALFVPPKYIFFSRYFYLPIIAVTIGFTGMFVQQKDLRPWVKKFLITGYLLTGIFITFINFYFDRSNISVALSWLKENMRQGDVLLYYNPSYEADINIGRSVGHGTFVITSYKDIDKIIDFIQSSHARRVFFLMNNHYKFRDKLFEATTGVHREGVGNRISNFLNFDVAGDSVLPGLRSCDLKEFQAESAVLELKRLEEYPPVHAGNMHLNPYQKKIINFILGPKAPPWF